MAHAGGFRQALRRRRCRLADGERLPFGARHERWPRLWQPHGHRSERYSRADQVNLQTEIHTYSVGGKTFYANNSNPKIPSALHGVVSGFAALNNFRAAGGSGAGTQGTLDRGTHTIKPLYTTGTTPNFTYGISPGDLDKIYDIPAATAQGHGGQNVNVGIIGDSDINVSYVNNYRSIFGLSADPPVVVVDGNDPGVNDDAYIAYKQIELVGAVAPNATIYYYTSATTDYDTGLDFALIRAVTDNHVQVLVLGFQSCETALGATGMFLVNQVTEEAAAQGMTVVAASGDSGAAGCEVPGTVGKATTGYAVNGYASSPFVTAVGGTDFFYSTLNPASTYWSTTNSGTPSYTSAKSYIPEQVWNDSYAPGGSGTSNSVSGTSVELASGGGPSTAGSDGVSVAQGIPSYQSTYQTNHPSPRTPPLRARQPVSSRTSRSSQEAAPTKLTATTAAPICSACSLRIALATDSSHIRAAPKHRAPFSRVR